jgi:hypothetical protein
VSDFAQTGLSSVFSSVRNRKCRVCKHKFPAESIHRFDYRRRAEYARQLHAVWRVRRNATANSKDVVVTGVSTGIGWGTKVLVSKGFRVFGSVRKQADADRLLREFGNGFVPLMMDITDADAVHRLLRRSAR